MEVRLSFFRPSDKKMVLGVENLRYAIFRLGKVEIFGI